MHAFEHYPYVLKTVFDANQFENIVDSNILTAYIPSTLPVPEIKDPRKTQLPSKGIPRHPGYVNSSKINQIFNYIGYVKRVNNRQLAKYLPLLFQELKKFVRVLEAIVYAPAVSITDDIFVELNHGLENFFHAYAHRTCDKDSWLEEVWKQQKMYLEHIDMFLKTLKIHGQVFDLKSFGLHKDIVDFCKNYFCDTQKNPPSDTDIHFVANCCLKAAKENRSKTIWSGDRHIRQILNALYIHSNLTKEFPQIYLRGNYLPLQFNQVFPTPKKTRCEQKL
jgi:hypothetical protein